MKIKNPVLFISFLVFLSINIADAITALFILKGEANPLFLMFGSIWPVMLLKFGIVFIIGWMALNNKFTTNFVHYMYALILVLGTMIVALGVYTNVMGIMNPEIMEGAELIPTEEKVQAYTLMVSIFYLLPAAFSMLSFKVYEWSSKYVSLQPNIKIKEWLKLK